MSKVSNVTCTPTHLCTTHGKVGKTWLWQAIKKNLTVQNVTAENGKYITSPAIRFEAHNFPTVTGLRLTTNTDYRQFNTLRMILSFSGFF